MLRSRDGKPGIGLVGPFAVVAAACLAVVLVPPYVGAWWLYGMLPSADVLHHERRKAFPWGYGHILLFGAIAATGAGLHVAAYYIEGQAHIGPVGAVLAVVIPFAIFGVMLQWLYGHLLGHDPLHAWIGVATGLVYVAVVALAGLALAVWLNVIGLRIGKWLPNVGAFGTWLPLAIFLLLAVWSFTRHGSATPFAAGDLIPKSFDFSSIYLFSTLLFAFGGLELAPTLGGEIHDPAATLLLTGGLQPGRPTMGAWVSYGLGSLNRNLPEFVVLLSGTGGQPLRARYWGNGFLPSNHQGVQFRPAGDPVLILDDVFAELDADRRQRLASLTSGYEQVLVTAAVEADIPPVLHAHVVRISAGTISDERDVADESADQINKTEREEQADVDG